MTNFKVLIIEDEPLYAANLEMLIEELGYECVGITDDVEKVLQMVEQSEPDLLLTDINLNGTVDGIMLAQRIHEKQNIPIIFITSLRDEETYERAKSIGPHAFIRKPFDEIDLQRTIELVVNRLQDATQKEANWSKDLIFKDCFFIKVRQSLVKIAFLDILYIEVENHHCVLHTLNKKFVVRMSLNDISKKLPPDLFLQTHRNYIVNARKIDSFDLADGVVLVAGKSIALSRGYKNRLLEWLEYL
ncbi:MAG: LytR/AlgR family response regulator transcription factor [Saprospiraceae bacterium]